MILKEILKGLCDYDDRNPDFFYDKDFPENSIPKNPCCCESCFRGNTLLANEILRLREIIKHYEKTR